MLNRIFLGTYFKNRVKGSIKVLSYPGTQNMPRLTDCVAHKSAWAEDGGHTGLTCAPHPLLSVLLQPMVGPLCLLSGLMGGWATQVKAGAVFGDGDTLTHNCVGSERTASSGNSPSALEVQANKSTGGSALCIMYNVFLRFRSEWYRKCWFVNGTHPTHVVNGGTCVRAYLHKPAVIDSKL